MTARTLGQSMALGLVGTLVLLAVVGCQSAASAGPPTSFATTPTGNQTVASKGTVPWSAAPSAPPEPAVDVPKVELAAMRARIQAGAADYLLLDARQPNEFAAGHVPTARNLPASQLPGQLANLPKDKEIVVYCYGRGCSLSRSVALKLIESGFPRVAELDGGVPEWQAAGYPIDR